MCRQSDIVAFKPRSENRAERLTITKVKGKGVIGDDNDILSVEILKDRLKIRVGNTFQSINLA